MTKDNNISNSINTQIEHKLNTEKSQKYEIPIEIMDYWQKKYGKRLQSYWAGNYVTFYRGHLNGGSEQPQDLGRINTKTGEAIYVWENDVLNHLNASDFIKKINKEKSYYKPSKGKESMPTIEAEEERIRLSFSKELSNHGILSQSYHSINSLNIIKEFRKSGMIDIKVSRKLCGKWSYVDFDEKTLSDADTIVCNITERGKSFIESGLPWTKQNLFRHENEAYGKNVLLRLSELLSHYNTIWFDENTIMYYGHMLSDLLIKGIIDKAKNDEQNIYEYKLTKKGIRLLKQYPDVTSWTNELTSSFENTVEEKPAELKTKAVTIVKKSFSEIMKENAVRASYSVASTQLNKLAINSIIALLQKQTNNEKIEDIVYFLNTSYGAALVSMMLGVSLNYVPGINKEDSRIDKLANELRINAMAGAGNELIGELSSTILPLLITMMKELPQLDDTANVRIEEGTINNSSIEESIVETMEEDVDSRVTIAV